MEEPDQQPEIRVTPDGPYEVVGLPIGRTHQIETEYGEPVDWAPVEAHPVDGPVVRLCRCGSSSTKPFCDDSHETADWDPSVSADTGPRAGRARRFQGSEVVMGDDHSLCTHAGYCGDRITNVWRMLGETADPEIRARLTRMVELCPSGTLTWAPEAGSDDVEPVFEASVAVSDDGPIWVRGGVPVVGPDGEAYEVRNRVTLCRCGRSANKPFCDGTHKSIGFTDP
ncbi:MAG: CDGSH iron-sulfur domain-containing protein [Actinomycetota bacterium]